MTVITNVDAASEAQSAGDRSFIRLSRVLAKPHAYAVAVDGQERALVVLGGAEVAAQRALESFPAGLIADAERRGWLGRGGEGKWCITALGRSALKRALSRSSGDCHGRAKHGRARKVVAVEVPRPSAAVSESPLGWLHQRRGKSGVPLITDEQFAAGERLRADYWFAGLSPRVTANWSVVAPCSRGGGGGFTQGDLADNVLAARERVNRALGAVGPELSSILVDVCCHLRGLERIERDNCWVARSAKVVLQLALTSLARHYGLLGARAVPMRTRHWGAEGYRPTAEGDEDDMSMA